jgi:hypothetical protein
MPAQTSMGIAATKLSNPPRRSRIIKGQKSMPSLPSLSTMQPAGPPPTCPLPALPVTKSTHKKKKRSAPTTRCPSPAAETQQKHAHIESPTSTVSTASTSPTSSEQSPQSSAAIHTRNNSSISSVGSVRHVTAWLASPKVAAFSAKYETAQPPKLDVAFEEDAAFSSSFGYLVT